MFIRKALLTDIIVMIFIQNLLLDKKKRDLESILFLHQKRINCWGKKNKKNNEDNVMGNNKKLQNCCKMFRDIEMKIWNDGV